MAKIKMTREGMASYLIVFGVLMLFSDQKAQAGIWIGIGILAIVLLIVYPGSKNF